MDLIVIEKGSAMSIYDMLVEVKDKGEDYQLNVLSNKIVSVGLDRVEKIVFDGDSFKIYSKDYDDVSYFNVCNIVSVELVYMSR